MKKIFAMVLVAGFCAEAAQAEDAMLREAQECTRHLPTMERLYNIPAHWLAAIASTESGRYHPKLRLSVPWPWTINVNGKGYWFDTKHEAIAAAERFQAQGIRSMDVGCMQVNMMYHGEAFSNLQQAFEPMYNIAYAAKFLKSKYDSMHSWTRATAAYHSMQSQRGADYYRKVYKKWQQVVDRLNDTMMSSPQIWQQEKLRMPPPVAVQEPLVQPTSPYRIAAPRGEDPSSQRVKWNSIKVTRGMPEQQQAQAEPPPVLQYQPQQQPQPMQMASNQPMQRPIDSILPGSFPSEAVTPLDVMDTTISEPAPQLDSPPKRNYERGVLVVRAAPPSRVEEPASAPPVNKGQFAPQSAKVRSGEEPAGEVVDERPRPRVVRPQFIF